MSQLFSMGWSPCRLPQSSQSGGTHAFGTLLPHVWALTEASDGLIHLNLRAAYHSNMAKGGIYLNPYRQAELAASGQGF